MTTEYTEYVEEQWTPINPCKDCNTICKKHNCNDFIAYLNQLIGYESLLTLLFNDSPIIIPQLIKLKNTINDPVTVRYKLQKQPCYLVHHDLEDMLKTITDLKNSIKE
jgi:hypothetical protein